MQLSRKGCCLQALDLVGSSGFSGIPSLKVLFLEAAKFQAAISKNQVDRRLKSCCSLHFLFSQRDSNIDCQ